MAAVDYSGKSYPIGENQTVLDALLSAGVDVPHSCRSGACQSCLMQAVEGTPPAASQAGLKGSLTQQGLFLPCLAKPTEDLKIRLPGALLGGAPARLAKKEWLSETVLRVWLEPLAEFAVEPGQFVNLLREDGLARSYSVANCPEPFGAGEASLLELHVRILPDGRMSQWLASEAKLGQAVQLRGPGGDCTYRPGAQNETLLLAGTGTGLAPLVGIARQALASGHRGEIRLFHGARNLAGLYLREELQALAAATPSLSYLPIVLVGEADAGVTVGSLQDEVLSGQWEYESLRTYLCGAPDLVNTLRKKLFIAGADLARIHADAFVLAPKSTPGG